MIKTTGRDHDLGEPATSWQALCAWIENPAVTGQIWQLDEGEAAGSLTPRVAAWRSRAYPELAADAKRVAAQLQARSLLEGAVIGVESTDPHGFVAGLFGCLYAGYTPMPLARPAAFANRYPEYLSRTIAVGQPTAILASSELLPIIESCRPRDASALTVMDIAAGSDEPVEPRQGKVALRQFTSGSTGPARLVDVTAENLVSNITMMRDRLEWNADDAVASWLPLHHDMGLIGLLIAAVYLQADLWQLRPEQFLTYPTRWLECLTPGRATTSASPDFGYAYAARRADKSILDKLDLSSWRHAVIGAERVTVKSLQAFLSAMRPVGYGASTFRPAYGLAEATLAVSMTPSESVPQVSRITWQTMGDGRPVEVGETRPLTEMCSNDVEGLIGCGKPLDRTAVTVRAASGEDLPDRCLGEIHVKGPNVTEGHDGCVATGDAGFLMDGTVYVVGRISDSISVRGKRVYVETYEAKVAGHLAMSPNRCVVVPSAAAAGDGVTVVVESSREVASAEIMRLLQADLGGIRIAVARVPVGTIPRTSSGKPRRRRMWQMVLEDDLDHLPSGGVVAGA